MATGCVEVRAGKRGVSVRCRYDLGPDPATGRRRQGAETVERLPAGAGVRAVEAARARAQKRLDAVLAGAADPVGGRTLLRDYLPAWLALHAASVEPSTARTYRSVIDRHIIPALGGVALERLTPLALERYLAGKRAEGRAANSVDVHRTVLTAALGQAVRWGMIPRSPLARVTRTRRRVKPVSPAQVWTAEQLRAFLAATADDRDAALWRLLGLAGLRLGEALALRRDAVDGARGDLAVRRTLTDGGPGAPRVRESTKSGRARVVALDAGTLALLAAEGEGAAPEALVFPGATGNPRHPSAVRERFRRLCLAAGVPAIRCHDLRHTHATLLLGAGVSPKVVADRLGHASVTITLDLYAHVLPAMRGGAVEAVEGLLAAPRAQVVPEPGDGGGNAAPP